MTRLFKMPPEAPPNFNVSPNVLIENTKGMLERSRKLQDLVASYQPVNATFANVLLPLAADEDQTSTLRRLYKFLGTTSPSADLREASNTSEVLITSFEAETFTREDLFQVIDAVAQKGEDIDPESQNYLETKHRAFIKNGLQIEAGPKRVRFAEIRRELQELKIAYEKSLNANSGLWLTVGDLDGFPSEMLAALKVGEMGTANEGKVWLPLKRSYLDVALRHVTVSDTRRSAYVANDNRCLDNVPRLKRTILLRDEAARLLGYQNHAASKLEENMTRPTEKVHEFICDVRERLGPSARKDLEALLTLKRQRRSLDSADEEVSKLHAWDYPFYTHLLKVNNHSFDQKIFSEYFVLEHTLEGMMATFSHLFSLQFHEIHKEHYTQFGSDHLMTWHPDVSVFSVWNADENGRSGEFSGYLYLDLFPRDKKYNHAGHYALSPVPSSSQIVRKRVPDTK